MRGKVKEIKVTEYDNGITPAYAGKSEQEAKKHNPDEDHPRVCGEKGERCPTRLVAPGSPPRMRGKELQTSKILR